MPPPFFLGLSLPADKLNLPGAKVCDRFTTELTKGTMV